jgi:hypothetical protein
MSTERVGGSSEVELPDDFADSTSWQRARDEETRIEPTGDAGLRVTRGEAPEQDTHVVPHVRVPQRVETVCKFSRATTESTGYSLVIGRVRNA